MVPLWMYLAVAAALFSLGVFGVLSRRNAVAILMSVELMLNAVNINLVAFWRYSETGTDLLLERLRLHRIRADCRGGGGCGRLGDHHHGLSQPAFGHTGASRRAERLRTLMDFLNDPNALPWLIPAGPLLAFLIITLITNKSKLAPATDPHEYGGHHPDYEGMSVPVVHPWSRVISVAVGMVGVLAALLISWQTLSNASQLHHIGPEDVLASSIAWMDTGDTSFNMGVLVDPATVIMLVMVPIAVLMIFIYSIGYMAHDPRQARFFALISLFAGAMLTLVVADNVLLLFVGWEIMGVCSYMLIGFWFEKESAYKAAIKAFTTTRIADVVMLLGIAYLYSITGTLSFREIMYNPETLDLLATTTPIIFGGWTVSAASIIGIFLIIGTVGKSAQFPLHVWLPDAMEGPTPVSAMIHAAAMVSAGIFSLIRLYPLFAAGGDPHHGVMTEPLAFMAVVGAFTALLAATMALAQNDVKAVLAYSTISQLGFMMAALGIGAYIAAAFHLITHAFFKALLFMAAGSVIHGMEHGEHHVHEHGTTILPLIHRGERGG